MAHTWSGRAGVRFPFILAGASISIVGWSIQLAQLTNKPEIRYFGLFMISAGASIQMPLSVVWLNNNLASRPEKAIAAALQMGFGNSANFVSSNMFITNEAPYYPTAFRVGTSLAISGAAATLLLALLLWLENSKLERIEKSGSIAGEQPEVSNSVSFRNTL